MGVLVYWGKCLAGAPEELDLPTDHPRPAVPSLHSKAYPFELSLEVTQALNAVSQQEGVTLFMTLLAAFQILLARYSGQDDIVVGSCAPEHNDAEFEEQIDFCAKTLILRTNLSGDPTFQQLLVRVHEVVNEAYKHQAMPFEKLLEVLHPEHNLSQTPLFQVFFTLQNAPAQRLDLTQLATEELKAVKADLEMSLVETEQGLRGVLLYSTDLFAASTIRRLLAH